MLVASAQQSSEFIYFEKFLTVVLLLFFSMHVFSLMPLTDYSDMPKVAGREKIHIDVSVNIAGCFSTLLCAPDTAHGAVLLVMDQFP